MENTSNPWTREELIDFCMKCRFELEGCYDGEYYRKLKEMSWFQLDHEADWLWGLMGK